MLKAGVHGECMLGQALTKPEHFACLAPRNSAATSRMKSLESKALLRSRGTALPGFAPISISEYVRLHAAANPGTDLNELSAILQRLLEAKLAGALCQCGEPIWAIGSAQVGLSCFTCITGETVPDHDYEIVAVM